jgi:hypothetical protein
MNMMRDDCPGFRTLFVIPLVVLALSVAGCGGRGTPPVNMHEALTRVNDNLSRVDRTVRCSALVSVKFRDADGKLRRLLGYEGRILFRAPRCLQIDVMSIGGPVAQFATNEERVWLWVEPEGRKMWWGTWSDLRALGAHEFPVPPDDLIDALMLRPIPEAGLEPDLRVQRGKYWLVYKRGSGAARREVQVDRYEPYQPVQVVDYDESGAISMKADLQNYRKLPGDGPYTPRRYHIYWPQDDTELHIDINSARFRNEAEMRDYCPTFPSEFQGSVERVGAAERQPAPHTPADRPPPRSRTERPSGERRPPVKSQRGTQP